MTESTEFTAFGVSEHNGILGIEEVQAETRHGQVVCKGSFIWNNHPHVQTFHKAAMEMTGLRGIAATKKEASKLLLEILGHELEVAKAEMEIARLRVSKWRRLIKEAKSNG